MAPPGTGTPPGAVTRSGETSGETLGFGGVFGWMMMVVVVKVL